MMNRNQQMSLDNHPELLETTQIENLFRLISYKLKKTSDGSYLYEATVYNSQATIKLTWISSIEPAEMNNGAVVKVRWLTRRFFVRGTNIVSGIERVTQLNSIEAIFTTIPDSWILHKKYYQFFEKSLSQIKGQLATLITHMLLDERVLYRFLTLPYPNLRSHNQKGGNFKVTTTNLNLALLGTYHEHFPTDREIFTAAVIIMGITRQLMWMYDDHNKRFFIPVENKKMHLNILAVRLVNETIKRYKVVLNDYYAHELDKVFKNKAQLHHLTRHLW
jgi:hypothetical protein